MDLYDKNKIGKKIADGGDRKVYMYDTDKVIKISSLSFFVGKKLHHKYINDHFVCENYFGKYVVETKDVSDLTTGKYIEIQEFIEGELLAKKHTKNLTTKSQLEEIVFAMDQMKKDKLPRLDLVGNIGMLKPCLSNAIVDRSGNIKIIDTTLLECRTVRPLGILLEIFIPLIIARQNYLLRKFLK